MIRVVSILVAVLAVAAIVVARTTPPPDASRAPTEATDDNAVQVPTDAADRQTGGAPAAGIPDGARPATVTSVTDGDTLRVDLDRTNEPVRLLELDTPEVTGDCGADEATAALRALAPVGSTLWLEADVEGRDRYDRLLRYLYRDDGTMINEILVREGWARAKLYPPNDRYWPLMQQAQREAQDRNANLWQRCDWA